MFNVFEKILNFSSLNKKILLPAEKITYGDFYKLSQFYFKFLKKNIKSKQVVCICSEYSVHYLALIFACYLNKNVINILNVKASNLEKKNQISDSKSTIIFMNYNDKSILKKKKKIGNFFFKKINTNYFFKKKQDF